MIQDAPCEAFSAAISNTMKDIKRLKSWPLHVKIEHSKRVIREFYDQMNGLISVSFSGGMDSTALLHLVRSIYPDTPAIFYDTGLEYPEIREFVKMHDNVEFIHPTDRYGKRITFKQVLEKYGYPVIGKEVSDKINEIRRSNPSAEKYFDGSNGRYDYSKFAYLIDAPFKISGKCCSALKKNPAAKEFRRTGRGQIIGSRIDESQRRETTFLLDGENRLTSKVPKSNPLSIWTHQDVKEYIRINNIPYCELYDKGFDRTGCMFCMFGAHLEKTPNRFQRMRFQHPKQYEYCMRPTEEGGLGLSEVLRFIGVPTGEEQSNLLEFTEEEQQ